MDSKYLEAIATLVGTIIGAGVLGIPYVVAKSGLKIGLVHILLLGIAILFINLYVAEISLRTKKTHQLVGYAEKYLGKSGKYLMTLSTIIGVYGALTAYLIGEGKTIGTLLGIGSTIAMIFFFVIFSAVIYKGLKVMKRWEFYLSIFMVLVLFAIIALALPNGAMDNLKHVDYNFFFLPYGVILFAFLGAIAIPEMKEIIITEKKRLRNAVIIGSLIPLIAYALFAIATVAVTGLSTDEIATIGLGQVLGTHMILLGNIFAILSMATSFLALGLGLKWMYQYDFHINEKVSWLLTIAIPLIIALSGFAGFIKILGFTGAISGGLEGILIVLMFHMARHKTERKPEFTISTNIIISGILVAIFLGGIIYTLLNL